MNVLPSLCEGHVNHTARDETTMKVKMRSPPAVPQDAGAGQSQVRVSGESGGASLDRTPHPSRSPLLGSWSRPLPSHLGGYANSVTRQKLPDEGKGGTGTKPLLTEARNRTTTRRPRPRRNFQGCCTYILTRPRPDLLDFQSVASSMSPPRLRSAVQKAMRALLLHWTDAWHAQKHATQCEATCVEIASALLTYAILSQAVHST